MPAMIKKCPGCGRNGIMKKDTGTCVHCSGGAKKGKRKKKVKVTVKKEHGGVTITESAPIEPKHRAVPKAKAKSVGRQLVGGRLV